MDPDEPQGGRPLAVSVGETFETFYAREYRPLVGLTYVLSGSRATAEDLAQEAMTVTYRRWSRVSAMDSPTGYLRRTAANLAASAVRRRLAEGKAMLRLIGQRAIPTTELPILPPDDDAFWAQVRRLPRRQAQAVALRHLYDCPVLEVAEVMGISEGAAKSHLHRARTTLTRDLGLPGPGAAEEVAS
jgi:RNA polymerase sigma factor (sigma-70 family)